MLTKILVVSNLLVALTQAQGAPGYDSGNFSPLQYHIQTDQGPERFFRFQTLSGQFRKEHRNPDGSVYGAYGWVDPNGVLRLYDYVSDAGGYRIEKERLYKVGTSAPGSQVSTRGGPLELGFEVFPLDPESGPSFTRSGVAPVPGPSGPRAIHIADGSFGPSQPYQVASLTSTNNNIVNPVSKQAQATYFHAEPIVKALPPPPPPPPAPKRIVIGSRHNAPLPEPEPERSVIVIGTADNGRVVMEEIRERNVVVGGGSNGRFSGRSRPAAVERSGVVIGHTGRRRRR